MSYEKKYLGFTHRVHDYGFVQLMDYMGDDMAVVEAARTSYQKGTRQVNNALGTLDHLMRNDHTSPFEQVVFKFRIKCPIFIFRQWVRHRTARLNEMSARYSEMPDEFYTPDEWRPQDTINKQGSIDIGKWDPVIEKFEQYPNPGFDKITATQLLEHNQQEAYGNYERLLKAGVAKEMARMALPVNIYTNVVWQMDLHNLFHFLRLRLDGHAQKEIRDYSFAMGRFVAHLVPECWKIFLDHRILAVRFSRKEQLHLHKVNQFNTNIEPDPSWSKGLKNEFKHKLAIAMQHEPVMLEPSNEMEIIDQIKDA